MTRICKLIGHKYVLNAFVTFTDEPVYDYLTGAREKRPIFVLEQKDFCVRCGLPRPK